VSRSMLDEQSEPSPYNHHLQQFLAFLKQERGFADATIVNRNRSLKPFLAWLIAQSVPLSGVSPATITKYFTGFTYENLPQGPSWEDVKKLIASLNGTSPVQIRSRCAILLCAVYGFRAGEVCWMRLEDIDWAEEKMSVRGSKQERGQRYSPVWTVISFGLTIESEMTGSGR